MAQVVRGMMGMGLALGVGALPSFAQSVALPAADPVGIARSGAQVAYGYSLEAAASNPALLASLKEKGGFYLAMGLELNSFQQSLESNQKSFFSTDRNRAVGAFGLAGRVSPKLTLGLKLDEPFRRHGKLPDTAPSRFLGDGIDLSARRMEGQLAWAFSPNVSMGLGLGVARLAYESTTVMRLNVPTDPSQPLLPGTNDVYGLAEQRVGEKGNKVVPSYSLGLRWALSPRWTLGFTHQSGLKGDLAMEAGFREGLGTFDVTGHSQANAGTSTRATALLARSQAGAGGQTLELPSQTTLGLRHRATPMFTWEADLRWISANLRLPGFATVQTPSGPVSAPSELPSAKGHLALSASTEVDLGKFWTLRAGLALEQRGVAEADLEPLMGGAATAAFSVGAGYRVWGGELSLGYQYRQSQDQDTRRLTGEWSATGFRATPVNRVRVEGMGHLLALGFKKTF